MMQLRLLVSEALRREVLRVCCVQHGSVRCPKASRLHRAAAIARKRRVRASIMSTRPWLQLFLSTFSSSFLSYCPGAASPTLRAADAKPTRQWKRAQSSSPALALGGGSRKFVNSRINGSGILSRALPRGVAAKSATAVEAKAVLLPYNPVRNGPVLQSGWASSKKCEVMTDEAGRGNDSNPNADTEHAGPDSAGTGGSHAPGSIAPRSGTPSPKQAVSFASAQPTKEFPSLPTSTSANNDGTNASITAGAANNAAATETKPTQQPPPSQLSPPTPSLPASPAPPAPQPTPHRDRRVLKVEPGKDAGAAATMLLKTLQTDAHRGISVGVMSPCKVTWAGAYDKDAVHRRLAMSATRPKSSVSTSMRTTTGSASHSARARSRHGSGHVSRRGAGRDRTYGSAWSGGIAVLRPPSVHASMVRAKAARGNTLLPEIDQCMLHGLGPPWARKTTKSVLAELRAQRARYLALRARARLEHETNRPAPLDTIAAKLAALVVPPKPPSAKDRWKGATRKIMFGIRWLGMSSKNSAEKAGELDELEKHARQPTFAEAVISNKDEIGALEQMFLVSSKASMIARWRSKAKASSERMQSPQPDYDYDLDNYDYGNTDADSSGDSRSGSATSVAPPKPKRMTLRQKVAADKEAMRMKAAADKADADKAAAREKQRAQFRRNNQRIKRTKSVEVEVEGSSEPAIIDYLHTTSVTLLVSTSAVVLLVYFLFVFLSQPFLTDISPFSP